MRTELYGVPKAPLVLAEIVQSIDGAISVDCELDGKAQEKVVMRILKPIVAGSLPEAQPRNHSRLAFIGDGSLCFFFANRFFHAYPDLDDGILSHLCEANINVEKLAWVAVRCNLYSSGSLFCNAPLELDVIVSNFEHAIRAKLDDVPKAPRALADLVQAISGAISVDSEFDLKTQWKVFEGFLEPFVTVETLPPPQQPVTMLP